jgi:hypothetical protein
MFTPTQKVVKSGIAIIHAEFVAFDFRKCERAARDRGRRIGCRALPGVSR